MQPIRAFADMTLVRLTEGAVDIVDSAVLVLDDSQPWIGTALALMFNADAPLQPKDSGVFWFATSLNSALVFCTIVHGMERDLLAAVLPLTGADSHNIRTETIVAQICVWSKNDRGSAV